MTIAVGLTSPPCLVGTLPGLYTVMILLVYVAFGGVWAICGRASEGSGWTSGDVAEI